MHEARRPRSLWDSKLNAIWFVVNSLSVRMQQLILRRHLDIVDVPTTTVRLSLNAVPLLRDEHVRAVTRLVHGDEGVCDAEVRSCSACPVHHRGST